MGKTQTITGKFVDERREIPSDPEIRAALGNNPETRMYATHTGTWQVAVNVRTREQLLALLELAATFKKKEQT